MAPHGWGYDGVLLYAPHSAYGTPDDLRALVDAAHGLGISVVLDIVLNHFGPEGNYLPLLSPDFFHKERMTPWGAGIAYDVEAARQYIVEAPIYWLTEFRFDGLRFDAIDQIHDPSQHPVLPAIACSTPVGTWVRRSQAPNGLISTTCWKTCLIPAL